MSDPVLPKLWAWVQIAETNLEYAKYADSWEVSKQQESLWRSIFNERRGVYEVRIRDLRTFI